MKSEKVKKVTEGFVETTVLDRNGKERRKYIYKGDCYFYSFNKLTLRQSKIITASLVVCSMILLSCSLLSNNELNAVPYAGGFSFLALIPMNFTFIGSLLFLIRKDMRVQQCRECQKSIYYGAECSGILMALSALGIIFYLYSRNQAAGSNMIMLIVNVIISVLQFMLMRLHQKKNYHNSS